MASIKIHNRRSIRLKGYDYTQPGAYFITLCAQDRIHLFGQIRHGEMKLNEFGKIVSGEWERTTQMRPNIRTADFVVMPNHIHGILVIADDDIRRGTLQKTDVDGGGVMGRGVLQYAPTENTNPDDMVNAPFKSPSKTIGAIIRGFKSATTKRINQLRNTPRLPVWQRNYYEHIIRNDASYHQITEYIRLNPARWEEDRLFIR